MVAIVQPAQSSAQECLQYALRHCWSQAKYNQGLVMKYLLPVQWAPVSWFCQGASTIVHAL